MYEPVGIKDSQPASQGLLAPGELWARVVRITAQAQSSGSLHSIPTIGSVIEQAGLRFLVRLKAYAQQPTLPRAEKPGESSYVEGPDPFLPYDPAMFVADLSATHLCLLNKFNVVDHHLLIVTRAFEHQDTLLTRSDFEALWACMAQVDGLGFYNGGKQAGASQRHKHLQLAPLPFTADGCDVPIEPALREAEFHGAFGIAPRLPFVHTLALLNLDGETSPSVAAAYTHELYLAMVQAVGLRTHGERIHPQQGAYNLLITRRWMLLAPRSQERCASISVNALGFAGSFFARDEEQLNLIRALGPLEILRQVGVSRV